MDSKQSIAKELFNKGLNAYDSKKYTEALHYFKESLIADKDNKECISYVNKSKENIDEFQLKINKEKDINELVKANDECYNIIYSDDYYFILDLQKEGSNSNNFIKKQYKSQSTKFHPDKNVSPLAEEAFTKIFLAFNVLYHEDTKKIYDKYKSEQTYKEKYYDETKKKYKEEEFDPYDVHQIVLNDGDVDDYFSKRHLRNEKMEQVELFPPVIMKCIRLINLLPLIGIALYFLYPSFSSTGIYSFANSVDYPYKKYTHHHKVEYYVGGEFIEKYTTTEDIKNMEKEIEKGYLTYLQEQCKEANDTLNKLEYKKKFYREGSVYYQGVQDEIMKLNLTMCVKYEKFNKKLNKTKTNKEDN